MHFSATLEVVYAEIIGISIYLWSAGGKLCSHSKDVGKNIENKTGRALTKASQIININPTTEINEIVDPIDDNTFQGVNASG